LLRKEVSALKTRIDHIESDKKNAYPNSQSCLLTRVISETSDHERCAKNIIVCGLPVCNSTILADRISADQIKLSDIFSNLKVSLPAYSKLLRIGKVVYGFCPVKDIFNSNEDASRVLHDIQRAEKQACYLSTSASFTIKRNGGVNYSVLRILTWNVEELRENPIL